MAAAGDSRSASGGRAGAANAVDDSPGASGAANAVGDSPGASGAASAVGVFCASSSSLDRRYLDLAFAAGAELGRRGHTLVSGGGSVGMMGRVAAGARSTGGHTLGVIPQSLVDLEVADTDSDELLVTADMADRKTLMIDRSDGFLVLPGGLGTLDELFEVWTTATLGVHAKPMVLLDVDGFYAGLVDWLRGLVPAGFVRAEALEQLVVAGDLPTALSALEGHLPSMDPLTRHETLFNAGVTAGDFGPWLETFHADATATFVGLPLGPFHGRDAIAAAYADNPPSSTMRVVDASRDGDVVRAHFVWENAPDTGGIFVFELRGDRLASLEVDLGAPPPPANADQPAD